LPFLSPGSKALADAVKDAAARHDVIIIKKHGLITIGKTMQEAYLKALIIEREARSQVICRLFRKKPPYITDKELASLAYL
jgi:L-fuculose-phosphate aldolase